MSFIKILRPFNCLFVMLCVFFGAFYQAPLILSTNVLFAMLTAAFIAGAGYVINDFFDLPIDKINRPDRVLPSGKISPQIAYLYGVFLFIMGILISFLTANLTCIALAIVNSLVLFYYAKTFKQSFLAGNLLVAYAAASTFVYGGIIANNLRYSLVVAIFAFIYTMIREMIKDIEDIPGDAKLGAHTFALRKGKFATIKLSLIFTFLILAYSIFLLTQIYISLLVFILLIILVISPLSILLFKILPENNDINLNKIQRFMKLDMFVLLIILWMDIL